MNRAEEIIKDIENPFARRYHQLSGGTHIGQEAATEMGSGNIS
jgi:hypothetical protein